jgi:PAS domain S-box-containing protein
MRQDRSRGQASRRRLPRAPGTQARLARVLASTPVILWAVDRRGIITLSEGRGLEALGLRAGQHVGRSLRELYADVPGAVENLDRALAGEQFTEIVRVRGLAFESSYFPERDDKGKVVGASGISVNVTELRRVTESLAEAQRIARLGSWEWEIAPDVVRWSDEVYRMFGVPRDTSNPREAFLGRLHPEDRERVERTAQDTVEQGGPYPVTLYRIVHPTAGVRTCEQRAELVRGADGSLASMIGTVQDVTEREAAREEIRHSQEGLAEAQRVAQIGSWEWDTATGQARWSDEYYRVLGLAPGAVPPGAASFFAATHPEDRPVVEAMTARVAASGSPETMLCRIVRPDGEVRFVRGVAKRLPLAGEGHRLVGTLQDITDLRRAEEQMSMLSGALEQTADSVFITDVRGSILYVNESFVRQSGFAREEALGETPRILKSGEHDPEFFRALWSGILEGRSWHGAFVNRRKDGSIYHEEKTITPIRDHLGRVTHFVSSGRDVTERRKSEATQQQLQDALARSASEWRSTFDAVGSPILILDRDGRVRRPNRAARDLSGRPYTEIMGCAVAAVGSGPLWSAISRATLQVTATGRAVSLQVRDEGTARTWDVSASPLTGNEVDGGGVIALARDVSPIVALQESLRRSETMSAMGRLVAGVAHEVRNPLFGISATLDAFDADFSDRPEYREYSRRLRAEVSRLADLMHDLLEYGRPAPPQLARGSLRGVIERAARACAVSARVAGVSLVTELAPDLPEIELDEGRLVQVYQNLIENAVQHSTRGSAVEISAASESDLFVTTGVADSGSGFREEDLSRVFEPFFTRRRGGTGLGLSIVHRIVTEHGGQIQATNRPAGGAVLRIRLPRSLPSGREA